MKKIQTAEYYISTKNTNVIVGFNMFIYGNKEPRFPDYADKSQWYSCLEGYNLAKDMAKKDGIPFTHPFKCEQDGCHPFNFGGFFVCNACGRKNVDAQWWKIQVEKDGNQYCCHGLDFANLQESENYAFGNTFEDAIENYGELMKNKY